QSNVKTLNFFNSSIQKLFRSPGDHAANKPTNQIPDRHQGQCIKGKKDEGDDGGGGAAFGIENVQPDDQLDEKSHCKYRQPGTNDAPFMGKEGFGILGGTQTVTPSCQKGKNNERDGVYQSEQEEIMPGGEKQRRKAGQNPADFARPEEDLDGDSYNPR